jgi:hypothetical protein
MLYPLFNFLEEILSVFNSHLLLLNIEIIHNLEVNQLETSILKKNNAIYDNGTV